MLCTNTYDIWMGCSEAHLASSERAWLLSGASFASVARPEWLLSEIRFVFMLLCFYNIRLVPVNVFVSYVLIKKLISVIWLHCCNFQCKTTLSAHLYIYVKILWLDFVLRSCCNNCRKVALQRNLLITFDNEFIEIKIKS